MAKRNCFGKRLRKENIIESNDFLKENGEIAWGESNPYAIEGGFDSRYEIIENYILKPGEKIVRYGPLKGKNSSVAGTTYEEVSLPYLVETVEYHELKVKKDITVQICVKKGTVAADFTRKGLGTQYTHYRPIQDEIDENNLREVKTWILLAWIKNLIK